MASEEWTGARWARMLVWGNDLRKLWWFLIGIMVLSALGNLIGGTDTPASARVVPASAPASVPVIVPTAPARPKG